MLIFWKVFKGNHLAYIEYVEQFKGSFLQVQTKKALFGHIDGEFFAVPVDQKLNFSVSKFQFTHVTDTRSNQEDYPEQVKIV